MVETKVVDILVNYSGINKSQISTNSKLKDELSIDSIGIIQIILELEEYFNITIPDDDLSEELFSTVGSIIKYVYQKKVELQ